MNNEDLPMREIKIGEDWTVPNFDGVGRRTLVKGAAWTVPVVAFATNASAAAASGQPTLDFVNGPYTATACQPLGTILLKATTDGSAPAINETVMITPPKGMTWANDGSSGPRGFQTDANGQATVTGLDAGSSNGSFVLNASTANASDTETVTVTGEKMLVRNAGGNIVFGNGQPLPGGATISSLGVMSATDGANYVQVLGSDGNAYYSTAANGATTGTAWSASTAFPGTTTLVATNTTSNGVGGVVSGTAC